MKSDNYPGKPNTASVGVAAVRRPVLAPESKAGSSRAAMLQQMEADEHDNSEKIAAHESLEGESGGDGLRLANLSTQVIVVSPYQPRLVFDAKAIEELATSIQTIGLGKPILVRPLPDGKYELVGGERRWRACCLAGLPRILAVVRDLSDDAARILAMTDNEQEDLTDYEWGRSYQKALNDGSEDSQRSLARSLGINNSIVSRRLMLMKLPDPVKEVLNTNPRLITANYVKRFLDLAAINDALVVEVVAQMNEAGLQQEAAIRSVERKLEELENKTASAPVPKTVTGIATVRITGKKVEVKCEKGIDPALLSHKIAELLNSLEAADLHVKELA